jgi:hypothetical protein
MAKKTRGGTKSGELIGSGPARVESVRLDSQLRNALAERARSDREATSSVIREALRQYLALG